ncbi:hypothetical protein [Methylorubrum suomiense]|uniref:Glycine zipper domain-containing protein n=1 Tax=Methylorubrum suomiense TaxID=144191 RepID=A0ABQ4UWY8_9HYPH|nr:MULTISPECIES: hypothetical protein [Methylobacteriaceae]GJE75232.1 hypothetical protein BGCPKDLD_1814 [Methylorubrum suomiense]
MRMMCLGLAVVAGLSASAPAQAESRTAMGVGAGAVAGALVGGPIGAVVGAVAGGVIGSNSEARPRRARRARAAARHRQARLTAPVPRRSAMAEPPASAEPTRTGSTGPASVGAAPAPAGSGWRDPR